jgi:hypothetical protein
MGQQEAQVEVHAVAQKVDAPPGSAGVIYGVAAPPGSSVAIPAGNATSSLPMLNEHLLTATSVPMWQQKKEGAKCCGCCCDYRRAVIVLAIIRIVFAVINIITVVTFSSIVFAGAVEDDQVEDISKGNVGIAAALIGIGLLTSICGLVGALKFNIWLVAVDLVWMAGKCSHE